MPNGPVLSVVTPVYNGEHFVARSYQCLRQQTFEDWEWVVVNDGSTDRTLEELRAIDDPRLQVTTYEANRGRGYARTTALARARGRWIVVWDIDDLYFPDRLARVNQARISNYDFMCSYALVADNALNVKSVRGFHPESAYMPRYFIHPTLACRAELARSLGYPAECRAGEDFTMVIGLALNYRGDFVEDALCVYQEDREIHLEKAIESNRNQLRQFRSFRREGTIRISPASYGLALARWWGKIAALQLLRATPRLYALTVVRRSSGETAPDWKLSEHRREFLDSMRRAWPVSGGTGHAEIG
jgi:glycosyltransferase involved in cell wall biosynthesis